MLKCLNMVLQCVYEPHKAATGFVLDKSIVTNAKQHTGSLYVYNIDLKDFFPSVDQARFWGRLQHPPFNLNEERNRLDIANIIAGLCFQEMEVERIDENGNWVKVVKNVLPQGAPTSPTITNIICERLDFYLSAVARRFGLKYSRYADDITFSSMHNVYHKDGDFIKELHRIIATQGFHIKESKVRLQRLGYRQEVTGLIVNEKVNVTKRYIKRLRMWLYLWEHYGYIKAEQIFIKDYIGDKGHLIKSKPNMANVIWGKLEYLKMVKGVQNENYLKTKQRYEVLLDTKTVIKQEEILILSEENILSKFESGFYKIEINENKYVFEIIKNNIRIIGDSGKGLDLVSTALNEAYKLDLELPKEWKVYKIEYDINKPSQASSKSLHQKKTIFDKISSPKISEKKSDFSLPVFHNPKELVTLLKNFSVNDSALKYTTHSWDAGRDANMFKNLSEFLSLAQDQYKAFSYKLNALSENLNGKIYNFLFNKEISKTGWGDSKFEKRIRFGWSSPELLHACNQDTSLNPEDFILPIQYQLQKAGKTIQKFKHVIDVFKNEIEIRDENSALLNLILQKHDTYLISFANPIIINLDNKTFYTDVQWLSKALDLIFENIQNRPQHRQVEYILKDERKDVFVLEILHVNSLNIGKSISDEKLKLEKGNFGDICKYLKNICDWSIESQFAEGYFRINYLSSEPDSVPHQKIEKVEGFKHILTFYK